MHKSTQKCYCNSQETKKYPIYTWNTEVSWSIQNKIEYLMDPLYFLLNPWTIHCILPSRSRFIKITFTFQVHSQSHVDRCDTTHRCHKLHCKTLSVKWLYIYIPLLVFKFQCKHILFFDEMNRFSFPSNLNIAC